jgi:hypothetical protein
MRGAAAFGFLTHGLPALGDEPSPVPPNFDHMLLGVSDLEAGVEFLLKHSGVRAALGGVHPGRGTRNALVALGSRRYLEIAAPDPAQAGQSKLQDERIREFRELKEPQLIGWAVHTNISEIIKEAAAAGLKIQGPDDGSRSRLDGKLLRWKTVRLENDFGVLPFFIEWSADSIHPSIDAPSGCKLIGFSAESPQASQATRIANLLSLGLSIQSGSAPHLRAKILGNKGEFDLS